MTISPQFEPLLLGSLASDEACRRQASGHSRLHATPSKYRVDRKEIR
jgi:hypothetical protein